MNHRFSYLLAIALATTGLACDANPDNDESTEGAESAESGESSAEGGESSSETGDSLVPCEGRDQASCSGLVDPEDEYGDSCVWASLVPLTDAGNSCAMGAPVGRCMAIAPVNDGCDLAPELECTLGTAGVHP